MSCPDPPSDLEAVPEPCRGCPRHSVTFDEMGVKKLPKVKELQTEYAKLLEEKKKTYSEYRRSREEMRELLTAKANVDRVLKMEVEQDVEKEKDHGQR